MPLRIRLQRRGRINQPFFRVVVVDGRVKQKGQVKEIIGWYDPAKEKDKVFFKEDRLAHHLACGAQPSESLVSLMKQCGFPVPQKRKKDAKKARRARARRKAAASGA